MMKTKKMLCAVVIAMTLAIMFTVPAFTTGTGDVTDVIEGTWTDASAQIETVVNSMVFPVIGLVLAVFFFAKLGMAHFDYRKHGQFEWAAPAILFAYPISTLTAPTYVWTILRMWRIILKIWGEGDNEISNSKSVRK